MIVAPNGREEDSFEPDTSAVRRSESERLALLELQLRHVNRQLADLVRGQRVIERIVIALAVAGGGAQVIAALTGVVP